MNSSHFHIGNVWIQTVFLCITIGTWIKSPDSLKPLGYLMLPNSILLFLLGIIGADQPFDDNVDVAASSSHFKSCPGLPKIVQKWTSWSTVEARRTVETFGAVLTFFTATWSFLSYLDLDSPMFTSLFAIQTFISLVYIVLNGIQFGEKRHQAAFLIGNFALWMIGGSLFAFALWLSAGNNFPWDKLDPDQNISVSKWILATGCFGFFLFLYGTYGLVLQQMALYKKGIIVYVLGVFVLTLLLATFSVGGLVLETHLSDSVHSHCRDIMRHIPEDYWSEYLHCTKYTAINLWPTCDEKMALAPATEYNNQADSEHMMGCLNLGPCCDNLVVFLHQHRWMFYFFGCTALVFCFGLLISAWRLFVQNRTETGVAECATQTATFLPSSKRVAQFNITVFLTKLAMLLAVFFGISTRTPYETIEDPNVIDPMSLLQSPTQFGKFGEACFDLSLVEQDSLSMLTASSTQGYFRYKGQNVFDLPVVSSISFLYNEWKNLDVEFCPLCWSQSSSLSFCLNNDQQCVTVQFDGQELEVVDISGTIEHQTDVSNLKIETFLHDLQARWSIHCTNPKDTVAKTQMTLQTHVAPKLKPRNMYRKRQQKALDGTLDHTGKNDDDDDADLPYEPRYTFTTSDYTLKIPVPKKLGRSIVTLIIRTDRTLPQHVPLTVENARRNHFRTTLFESPSFMLLSEQDMCPPECFLCVNNTAICQVCQNGYTLPFNATVCVDINECLTNNAGCDPYQNCQNGIGNFTCLPSCVSGYIFNLLNQQCVDINECATTNGGCGGSFCSNTAGSFACSIVCLPGYLFNGTSSTCYDINECFYSNGGCSQIWNTTTQSYQPIQTCVNTDGGFACSDCFCGFVPNMNYPNICYDQNECISNNGGCSTLRPCVNTVGSYYCGDCTSGYQNDGIYNCTAINECASFPCQNGGFCLDGVNSYLCLCTAGFSGTNCQTNIDECVSFPCQNGGSCIDGINNYICNCSFGFTGTNCEISVNTCASNPCQNGATCNSGINSHSCTCAAGFSGVLCQTNINECASSPCQNGASCNDGLNSFTCDCTLDYYGTLCENNFDQCDPPLCTNGATCVDGIDSFICICPPGFSGFNCETNINDCASFPCQNGGSCVDGIESYTCTCPPIYYGNHCEFLLNPCVSNPCQNGASCINYFFSYSCTCLVGYTGVLCENDINECDNKEFYGCDPHSICNNTIGSFDCFTTPCEEFWMRISPVDCIDINECASNNGGCPIFDNCTNVQGGPPLCNATSCPYGYEKVNGSCIDIDECSFDNNWGNCDPYQWCQNTLGGYACEECQPNMFFNVTSEACENVDVCATPEYQGLLCGPLSTSECVITRPLAYLNNTNLTRILPTGQGYYGLVLYNISVNYLSCTNCIYGYVNIIPILYLVSPINFILPNISQTYCVNSCNGTSLCSPFSISCNISSLTCGPCQSGFTGNGSVCTDINECVTLSQPCPLNQVCVNTIGSYTCQCTSPYWIYNGTHCNDVNECFNDNVCIHSVCTNLIGYVNCSEPCDLYYNNTGSTIDPFYPGFPNCTFGNPCDHQPCDPLTTCTRDGVLETFYCGPCPSGYNGTGLTGCVDINECLENTDLCSVQRVCNNTIGYYVCGPCPPGYFENSLYTCMEIDECASNPCIGYQQHCVDHINFYTCECNTGYRNDTNLNICLDIDECNDMEFPDNCTLVNTHCVNTVGGFYCACDCGYEGNPYIACTNIDECAFNQTCALLPCVDLEGSFMCEPCPDGYDTVDDLGERLAFFELLYPGCYSGSGIIFNCTDINECSSTINGGCDLLYQICQNFIGSFSCGPCSPGFMIDPSSAPFNNSCININECATLNGGCNGTCFDTIGSYGCNACSPGFEFNFILLNCTDIDECVQEIPVCDPIQTCMNIPGSYICGSCPPGYNTTINNTCVDINECADIIVNTCTVQNLQCNNTQGSFMCVVPCIVYDYNTNPVTCVFDNPCLFYAVNVSTPVGVMPIVTGPCGTGRFCIGFGVCTNCVGSGFMNAVVNDVPIYNTIYFNGTVDIQYCADINECAVFNGGCDTRANCTNTIGSRICGPCPPGFFDPPTPSFQNCVDLNECVNATVVCPGQTCVNLPGSFNCTSCLSGYMDNGMGGCVDINECTTFNGGCSTVQQCVNTPGSFNCTNCPAGYYFDGVSCVDINECTSSNGGCDTLQECFNTPGSFFCGTCPPGYFTFGALCIDNNECESTQPPCPLTTCFNLIGSYNCSDCAPGYITIRYSPQNVTACILIDVCLTNNGGCHTLQNCTMGICGPCPSGYYTNGTDCVNINECSVSNGGCSTLQNCTDTIGSFICGPCPYGYVTSGNVCTDINECATSNGGCDTLQTCNNIPGSYNCGLCPFGYITIGNTCVDINECATTNGGCDTLQTCSNTPGSFNCGPCPLGFTNLTSPFICVDINECVTMNGGCSTLRTCFNSFGSFICGNCSTGYVNFGPLQCLDINECLNTTVVLPDNCGNCFNFAGGFTCACNASSTQLGYIWNNITMTCDDINECVTNNGGCNTQYSSCVNTPGTFYCNVTCPIGYLTTPTTCIEINECSTNNGGCSLSPFRLCINTNGSFICGDCPNSYVNNGTLLCTDINECLTPHCFDGRPCVNTPGSFFCGSCPFGFSPNGPFNCSQITNNCTKCDPLQTCNNITGVCSNCPPGYNRVIITLPIPKEICVDINECASFNGGCSTLQTCKNLNGTFTCGNCPAGYRFCAASSHDDCDDDDDDDDCECDCDHDDHDCNSYYYFSNTFTYNGGDDDDDDDDDDDHQMINNTCCDINECLEKTHDCRNTSEKCVNTIGNYTCKPHCPIYGTVYDPATRTCKKVNTCLLCYNGGCPSKSYCYWNNITETASCIPCPSGYRTNGNGACIDLNECSAHNGGCDYRVNCVNTIGSYYCTPCPSGYQFKNNNLTCTDINECKTNNGGCVLRTCVNTQGSFYCVQVCPPGTVPVNATHCKDINECATNNGACVGRACINLIAAPHYCGPCPFGYTPNTPYTCSDINECTSNLHNCSLISQNCINTLGSFYCVCKSGYVFNGTACTKPVNPCLKSFEDGGCDPLRSCSCNKNTKICTCGPCASGYLLNTTSQRCIDINECRTNNGGCATPTTCVNLPGSYHCQIVCSAGYQYNVGKKKCVDINECSTNNGGCDPFTTKCANLPGNYTCLCLAGHVKISFTTCVDVNECALNNGGCDSLVDCTNIIGSYVCDRCPLGYLGPGDNIHSCQAQNACTNMGTMCDPYSTCQWELANNSRTCGECSPGRFGNPYIACYPNTFDQGEIEVTIDTFIGAGLSSTSIRNVSIVLMPVGLSSFDPLTTLRSNNNRPALTIYGSHFDHALARFAAVTPGCYRVRAMTYNGSKWWNGEQDALSESLDESYALCLNDTHTSSHNEISKPIVFAGMNTTTLLLQWSNPSVVDYNLHVWIRSKNTLRPNITVCHLSYAQTYCVNENDGIVSVFQPGLQFFSLPVFPTNYTAVVAVEKSSTEFSDFAWFSVTRGGVSTPFGQQVVLNSTIPVLIIACLSNNNIQSLYVPVPNIPFAGQWNKCSL